MADYDTWGPGYGGWYQFNGIPYSGGEGEPLPDGREGERRAYTASAWVYRCIDILATQAVSVQLKCYEPAAASGKTPTEVDHDALALLRDTNPIDYVTGDDLTKMAVASLELHGENYLQFETGSRGVPLEIYWRPVQTIEPVLDPRKGYAAYKVTLSQGKPEMIPAEMVAFMRYPDPSNPLRGLGRISAARNGLNLEILGEISNLSLQKNGMRPSFFLTSDQDMAPDKVTFWQKLIREWLGGPIKRGRPAVLGGGLKPMNVAMTPSDAEWVESMRLAQEQICAIFGVPLVLAGNQDRSTYNNYAEARKVLWQDRLIPWLDWYGNQLTQKVLYRVDPKARARGLYLKHDYAGIEGLGEDTTQLWDRVLSAMATVEHLIQVRAMKPNQARIVLAELASQVGLDPAPFKGDIEGGDEVFIPYNMIPDHEAGVQTVIDIMAARGQNPQLEEDVPGAPHIAEDANKPNPDQGTKPAAAPKKPQADQQPKVLRLDRAFKSQAIRAREARLAPAQDKLTRRLKRHFQDLQTETMRTLKGEGKADNAAIPEGDLYDRAAAQARLQQLIREGWSASAAAAYLAAQEDYGLNVAWDDSNPWLDQFMGKRLHLVQGIDDTTHDTLRSTLLEGAQAGETIPELAQRVSNVFTDAIENRAVTIARTETIQAYGSAALASYADAGVEQAQMYDGDYDEECAAVDGMVVGLDEADALMADEHPNGRRGVTPIVDIGAQSEE